MGLIRFCVRRPVFTWVTVLLACFLGVYSYFKLGVALYPKVDIPVVVVYAAYRGASPGEIEQLVAKPLEDAVSKVEGVKKIESYSLEGFCYVVAELFYEVDLNQATLDVSNKVKETREKLPKDADEPTVEKVDINADSFMKVVFTSPLPPKQARDILDDQVVRQLTRVTGVAEVDLAGGQEREIHLLLDPRALKSYGVSIQRVAALIAANNVTNPSGYIAQGDREITLRFKGEAPAVQALGEIRVPLQNGASVRLSALGRIEDGIKDVRRLTRYDGADAFLIYVKARPNANVVNVGRDVRKALDRILPTLPGGFKMDVAFDDSEFIRDAVKNVLRDMVVGTLLTGLVLYLFLRRLSATLVVALAMPAAVLATFVPMVGQGFTLNVMSTLGLAITMGVLVNNSILIIENIYRFRDMGFSPEEAAEKGTVEIAVSVLAGTATNLGVFLPVAVMSGIAGQFLVQYAMTIVYATVFSLWVSLTVTPMVAARIMGAKEPSRISRFLCGWWTWLYQGFEDLHHALITRAVLHPWKTVLFFLALTGGCFALASRIGTEFLPRADDGTVTLQMELPAESSLARTDRLVRVAEEHARQLPHVRHVTAVTGSTGSRSGTHMGKVELTMDKDKTVRPSSFRIASDLRPFAASLPDATVSVQAVKTRRNTDVLSRRAIPRHDLHQCPFGQKRQNNSQPRRRHAAEEGLKDPLKLSDPPRKEPGQDPRFEPVPKALKCHDQWHSRLKTLDSQSPPSSRRGLARISNDNTSPACRTESLTRVGKEIRLGHARSSRRSPSPGMYETVTAVTSSSRRFRRGACLPICEPIPRSEIGSISSIKT